MNRPTVKNLIIILTSVLAFPTAVLSLASHSGRTGPSSAARSRRTVAQSLPKLRWPLSNFTPYNVGVNSVLDHSRANQNIVVAYTGERGRQIDGKTHTDSGLKGYEKLLESQKDGKDFIVNGQYTGDSKQHVLWYETPSYQHPGYDFRVDNSSYITAAADGKLWIAKEDSVNGKNKTKSAWQGFHTFKIVHSNGLVTWYLHAERFVSPSLDGTNTRNLDAEVRNKMGGDAFYNGLKEISGDIEVGPVKAGERIAKPGGWPRYGRHLHFEVRLNGNLIDPYGWEGEGVDPLPNNPGGILWDGYTKPTITSAVVDTSNRTLIVSGKNFESGSTLDIWRKFENNHDTLANKSDGTRAKNLPIVGTSTATRITARIDQNFIDNLAFYRVKVATPSGPRSVSTPMTVGPPPRPEPSDFSMSVIPFVTVVTPGDISIFSAITKTTSGNPQTVNFSVTGLPRGTTHTIEPATITSGGVTSLIVRIGPSTPRGTHVLTITAKGTTTTRQERVQLILSSFPKAVIAMSGGGKSGGNDATLSYGVPPDGNVLMTFNAANSSAPESSIKNHWWYSNEEQISVAPKFDFRLGRGTHQIKLMVANADGLRSTATATVVVSEDLACNATGATKCGDSCCQKSEYCCDGLCCDVPCKNGTCPTLNWQCAPGTRRWGNSCCANTDKQCSSGTSKWCCANGCGTEPYTCR